MVDGIVEFYPYVINTIQDLKHFIVRRIPPASKTDANAGILDGEELLEQFSNIQVCRFIFFQMKKMFLSKLKP